MRSSPFNFTSCHNSSSQERQKVGFAHIVGLSERDGNLLLDVYMYRLPKKRRRIINQGLPCVLYKLKTSTWLSGDQYGCCWYTEAWCVPKWKVERLRSISSTHTCIAFSSLEDNRSGFVCDIVHCRNTYRVLLVWKEVCKVLLKDSDAQIVPACVNGTWHVNKCVSQCSSIRMWHSVKLYTFSVHLHSDGVSAWRTFRTFNSTVAVPTFVTQKFLLVGQSGQKLCSLLDFWLQGNDWLGLWTFQLPVL
jgi:hypothetical protein